MPRKYKRADRDRGNTEGNGARKRTTRESVAKAQANAAERARDAELPLAPSRESMLNHETAGMVRCSECGVEFVALDPLGGDICDTCCDALCADLYDSEYDESCPEDFANPGFDWLEEWNE